MARRDEDDTPQRIDSPYPRPVEEEYPLVNSLRLVVSAVMLFGLLVAAHYLPEAAEPFLGIPVLLGIPTIAYYAGTSFRNRVLEGVIFALGLSFCLILILITFSLKTD